MTDATLEEYLVTVRPDARQTVRALASAIDASGLDLDRRFTYQMLVYTFDRRWHDWVVGISVGKKAVSLRLLFGQRLDDSARLLRPGSTTAGVIDYAGVDDVDGAVVTAYVKEAAAKHSRS